MMHTETGESPLLSPAFRAETVINPSGYGNRDAACAKTRKCPEALALSFVCRLLSGQSTACGAGNRNLTETADAGIVGFPRPQSSDGVMPLRPLSFVIQTGSRRSPNRPNPRRTGTRRCILCLVQNSSYQRTPNIRHCPPW